jgi:hypothetical protein
MGEASFPAMSPATPAASVFPAVDAPALSPSRSLTASTALFAGAARASLPGKFRDALNRSADPTVRGVRVTLLLGAVALVSIVDLMLTLKLVTSVGMIEANPIARMVMQTGDTTYLTIFKMTLTAISLGAIFWCRRHKLGEIAAWICFCVMLALSLQWAFFLTKVQNEYTADWNYLQQSGHPAFVMMTDE